MRKENIGMLVGGRSTAVVSVEKIGLGNEHASADPVMYGRKLRGLRRFGGVSAGGGPRQRKSDD